MQWRNEFYLRELCDEEEDEDDDEQLGRLVGALGPGGRLALLSWCDRTSQLHGMGCCLNKSHSIPIIESLLIGGGVE